MSYQYIELCRAESKAKGPAKSVLLMLAHRAHDSDACCWPGYDGLAFDTGFNRRTVIRAVKTLERLGEIVIQRKRYHLSTKGGRQKSNLYRITLVPKLVEQFRKRRRGSDRESPKGSVRLSPEYKHQCAGTLASKGDVDLEPDWDKCPIPLSEAIAQVREG